MIKQKRNIFVYSVINPIIIFQHNIELLQVYGLTETSPLVTTLLAGSKNLASAGVAISNTELRIVDSNHRNLGPNEVSIHTFIKRTILKLNGFCSSLELIEKNEHYSRF